MRVATIRGEGGSTRAARVEGDQLVLLDHPDAAAALAAGGAQAEGPTVPVAGADLAPPSVRPQKIFCVGLNYEAHITEMGRELPTHPTLFAKFARALIGPGDDITLPAASDQVDWEAELAVVIGREARDVTEAEAPDAIAGYTVLNDVTARDWQRRTPQWLSGKTFEGSTPLGPVIATPDEVGHAADLEVSCEVDGEVVQLSRTSDLVFGPAALVAYASSIITLDVGDVIATGTPGGVGAGRTPPVFLKAGQEVRTRVEGIGELVNVCRDGR